MRFTERILVPVAMEISYDGQENRQAALNSVGNLLRHCSIGGANYSARVKRVYQQHETAVLPKTKFEAVLDLEGVRACQVRGYNTIRECRAWAESEPNAVRCAIYDKKGRHMAGQHRECCDARWIQY